MGKFLISNQGYGSGWSTNILLGRITGGSYPFELEHKAEKFALTYEPIINYLEAGGTFAPADCELKEERNWLPSHPLLVRFVEDLRAHLADNDLLIWTSGARDLSVQEYDGAIQVQEYDGLESWDPIPVCNYHIV